MVSLAAVSGVVACSAQQPALAQSPTEQTTVTDIESASGLWSLTSADNPGKCQLALSRLGDPQRNVVVEKCELNAIRTVVQWRLTAEGVELLSEDGALVLALRREGVDRFRSARGEFEMIRTPMF